MDFFSPGLSGKPPVILVICSDMEKALRKGGENSKIYGCMMDASMAAENLMLAALEYGLGTCAVKSYNDAAIRKILQIPEGYRIEVLISIGYPAGFVTFWGLRLYFMRFQCYNNTITQNSRSWAA